MNLSCLSYTILTTVVQSQMASVSNWREKSSFFSDWHDKNSENKRWILWAIQIEIRNLKKKIALFFHMHYQEVHLWVSVSTKNVYVWNMKTAIMMKMWRPKIPIGPRGRLAVKVVSLNYFLWSTLSSLADLYTICFQILRSFPSRWSQLWPTLCQGSFNNYVDKLRWVVRACFCPCTG